MVDESDQLQRAFTKDGLHLNRDGYVRLSALLHPTLMQTYYFEAGGNDHVAAITLSGATSAALP